MSKPSKRTGHRNYVQLWTAYVSDVDFIILGQAARHAAPLFVMYSGQQGHNGHIPADPRRVQAFLMMDDGVPAAEAVVNALVEARFLELTDDPEWLRIRSWNKYQADMGGSESRAASNAVASLRQHHRLGNGLHPQGVVDGCPDCAAGVPSPATPQVPARDIQAAIPASLAKPEGTQELTAADVKARVRQTCDNIVASYTDAGLPLAETYRRLYAAAAEQTTKYETVKGITETVLLNTVVAHAAVTLWTRNEKPPTNGTLSKLSGLRATYGPAVLEAIVAAADADKPLPYAMKVLTDSRAVAP